MTNLQIAPRRLAGLLVAGVVLALTLAPSGAGAIVPPRNCGMLEVGGARYNIKADQIRCRPARKYSKRYLQSGWRPSGYSCRRYSGSALRFRCTKGIRSYFAIRR
jgi:hypothetical protein